MNPMAGGQPSMVAGCSERTGEKGKMGVLCLSGKVWASSEGDYMGGFSEKLPETSPVSDEDSASWIQDGTTADQSWAHHWQW